MEMKSVYVVIIHCFECSSTVFKPVFQSQATIEAPSSICDKPRRMPLVKATFGMVREAAVGSVSRKNEAERLAQLCSCACNFWSAAPSVPDQFRRD
jgi:hypothetical protein